MKTYKAPDNSLHCIDPEFAYLLPKGCVEITDEEAEALRPTQPWSSAPLLTRAREMREECLNRLAGIGLIALFDGDSATVAAIKTARQSLLDITDLPAVKSATNDAELTAAINAEYTLIVQACPLGLRSVFRDARL